MKLWTDKKVGILIIFGFILAVLIAGCPNPTIPEDTDPDPVAEDPADEDPDAEVVYTGIDQWSIAPGYENTASASILSIAGSDKNNGAAENQGSLQVTWQSSTDFRSCELYAALPVGDYSSYAGIRFDIALPVSINMLALIRIPDGGTTWKVFEDYIYRGTDEADTIVWTTIELPFSAATDTGWGPAADPASFDPEWLAARASDALQINLNPILNVGGGGAVDSPIVMHVDNVGFYQGTESGSDDLIIWDFEPEA